MSTFLIKKNFIEGGRDFFNSVSKLNLIFYFAWSDTKARYRRSTLGPFWMVVSTLVSVAGLGMLWAHLFKVQPNELVPSLTVGLVVWQLLSNTITEGTAVLYRYSNYIKNIPNPISIYPLILLTKNLINFLHNSLVIILVFLIYPESLSIYAIFSVLGLLLLILNLAWISILISLLGSRFRDLEQIIGSLLPLVFFLTPIIYRPEYIKNKYGLLIFFNPFSHFISLIRDPLLGKLPSLSSYLFVVIMLVVGTLITLFVLGSKTKRVPFWV